MRDSHDGETIRVESGFAAGSGIKVVPSMLVRNGFTPALKRESKRKMMPFENARCPFTNLPEPKGARREEALVAEVMNRCGWLKPHLVAQIGFTDLTQGNRQRHSRFPQMWEDEGPVKSSGKHREAEGVIAGLRYIPCLMDSERTPNLNLRTSSWSTWSWAEPYISARYFAG